MAQQQAFSFNFGDNNQSVFQEPTEEDLKKQADEDLVKNNPKQVVERVRVLQYIQDQYDELKKQLEKEIHAIEKKYEVKYEPLYNRRKEIVTGAVDVTEQEKKQADEKVPLPETDAKPKEAAETDASIKGIPEFWSTAIQNSEVGDVVQEWDEEILKHLIDVSFENHENDKQESNGFKLTFTFSENEFFSNTTLTKTFSYDPENDDEPTGSEGTEIQWKEGKNVTVKTTIKKQRHKGGNRVRKVKKETPQDSFFNFFKTVKKDEISRVKQDRDADEDDEDDEEEEENGVEELIELDQQMGDTFRESIIPNAVQYFLGVIQNDDMEDMLMNMGMGDMDGIDFGGDNGEDDEDEEDQPPRKGGRSARPQQTGGATEEQPECKQQ